MNPLLIKYGLMALAFIGWTTGVYFYATSHEKRYWVAKNAEERLVALKKGQDMQRAADQVAIDLAGTQAVVQEKLITKTVKVIEEVPIYVKDDSACITYGFVRVLDARVFGVDPSALTLPAGELDDTCAPVKWRVLAKSIASNYGTADQNAGQLTGLQDYVRGVQGALSSTSSAP